MSKNKPTSFEPVLWLDFFSRKTKAQQSIIDVLKQNQLFKRLTPFELKIISRMVHERRYEPGEVIFSQNEKGLGMYMISSGRVEIRVRAESPHSELRNASTNVSTTSDGELHVITNLTEGSFFGELALVDDESRRTATALCLEATTLLGFFKPDLMEILERRPEMGVKILLELSHVLGARLAETTRIAGRL